MRQETAQSQIENRVGSLFLVKQANLKFPNSESSSSVADGRDYYLPQGLQAAGSDRHGVL